MCQLPESCVASGQSLSLSEPFQHSDNRLGCTDCFIELLEINGQYPLMHLAEGPDHQVRVHQAACLSCLQPQEGSAGLSPIFLPEKLQSREVETPVQDPELVPTRSHCQEPGLHLHPQPGPPDVAVHHFFSLTPSHVAMIPSSLHVSRA